MVKMKKATIDSQIPFDEVKHWQDQYFNLLLEKDQLASRMKPAKAFKYGFVLAVLFIYAVQHYF
jgi:hypothetical protein